jgi:hypothetical protein
MDTPPFEHALTVTRGARGVPSGTGTLNLHYSMGCDKEGMKKRLTNDTEAVSCMRPYIHAGGKV